MKKPSGPRVSPARLRRAVASSTAIETGKPVAEIEAKLNRMPTHLKHLTLTH